MRPNYLKKITVIFKSFRLYIFQCVLYFRSYNNNKSRVRSQSTLIMYNISVVFLYANLRFFFYCFVGILLQRWTPKR